MKHMLELKVNGKVYEILVEPWDSLMKVLRDELYFTGTKEGCNRGDCGACTVLMDGKPVYSCLLLALQARGKEIMTIEGLATEKGLHPLQEAFIEHFAVQCGYCSPGMIMSAKALLDENPNPSGEEVKIALEGNLCRCGGYAKIIEAVLAA